MEFPKDVSVVEVATIALVLLMSFVFRRAFFDRKRKSDYPPAVPGLPLIGNLLQLKAKKPHQTFAKWAEQYGPIYSIKTGASSLVVLNTSEVAKEAMVTRFSFISSRKLSNALTILTANKSMVAMSDYGDFHKIVKRNILTSILGPNAQKRNSHLRANMVDSVLDQLHVHIKENALQAVNLRALFKEELFKLALRQALGKDIESIYVAELGKSLSKSEIFDILVVDPMMGAIEVDWRDFFPYLRWVPNKALEDKIQRMAYRRGVVTRALIEEQKKRIKSGEKINCYLDFLLSEAKTLTEEQLTMLVWEAIIETSDTTLVTTEWAMFELAKNPHWQDRLHQDIQRVCGSEKLTEEHLPQLPCLSAVFHETLRKHSPVPIVPLRYVNEDTQLGGYKIPSGSEIAINIYGCHMDKKEWDLPEEWKPERFLGKPDEAMDLHKTMAFGGGRRICAGALQAMLISCSAIGRFVQDFEWRLKEGEEENEDTVQLTTHKLKPMLAFLTPRNK
ncbi:hypothetical protein H6P81_000174 [Aristolochia fimbriata]|uniref:Ent-kaurene oxidase n=1 Tax=Aristolochia fimbriata TaxID=158543 RepID=A0AAV7F6B7_ARIFI|nr:hypothetical protein H6P81_000174 [Aristolochia fimbriata]